MVDLPQLPPISEVRLMQRVKRLAGPILDTFSPSSSVPEAFWAALTANETGEYLIHNLTVPKRFEPLVYKELIAVLQGIRPSYGKIKQQHLRMLGGARIRLLASSHGLTQIMGYHTIELGDALEDLDVPEKHYPIAANLMAGFVSEFNLDPASDFEPMARCWNTGQPWDNPVTPKIEGKTYDPNYVQNLLLRMKIWEALS